MAPTFYLGQRYISRSEPELGLGAVRATSLRTVTLHFGACDQTREYGLESAPLQRVRFNPGDEIQDRGGRTCLVRKVREQHGILVYGGDGGELPETELSDQLSFDKPEARLLAGHGDPPSCFDLRIAALKHQHRRGLSPVRGFGGARIELIPHQFAIAAEVAERLAPRVLLADEVGLGKTIEACLILQRLVSTGRVQRALILVPESLVHQWFVELLRRFHLWFSILDEERCGPAEEAEANPFQEAQFVLCAQTFLRGPRLEQALEADWDLLVVDEAHHLAWSPEKASEEYLAVEALGRKAPALLLLTATPEQLGMTGHFARLRLLDPDRFGDLERFLQEAGQYQDVARLADDLLLGRPLDASRMASLARLLGDSETELQARLQAPGGIQAAVAALVDRHGTGRVMFRNTRAAIQGFPVRRVHLVPLEAEAGAGETLARRLQKEWQHEGDAAWRPSLQGDPRLLWLKAFLVQLGEGATVLPKVLVICRTRLKAEALEAALRPLLTVKTALFHEGLSLVQRDRAAAWFGEEQGARLMICSEIGSEGRNFQMAGHLVLFDLPRDPALLEQRIGRLDRIGQGPEIHIHVPYVKGSPQEVLARWYHEGLDAFAAPVQGTEELRLRFASELQAAAQDPTRLGGLLEETRQARQGMRERLEQGRDRLLELNTGHPERAAKLIQEVRVQDADRGLEGFLLAVLDQAGIPVEEVAPRTYHLGSAGVLAESFPGLSAEGLTLTCDRARTLIREDLPFLSWDHPLMNGALDLVLSSEKGNSCFVRWPDAQTKALYLEAIYVLEALAPPALHADRFLPPTPLRILVDHQGRDQSRNLPRAAYLRQLEEANPGTLMEQPGFRDGLLPRLMSSAQRLAQGRIPGLIEKVRKTASQQLREEEARLRALQRLNPAVREDEIQLLASHREQLDAHLAAARLRLDALRIIHRG